MRGGQNVILEVIVLSSEITIETFREIYRNLRRLNQLVLD